MKRSLEDFLEGVPRSGGRSSVPKGVFKDPPVRPATQLDKTTAAAREILDAEAQERAEKGARLKAAREARDRGTTK